MVEKMKEYKYISENSLTEISLHDCGCEKIYINDKDMIFNMEFMEICSEHELNPFPLAHQSNEGKIIFKNVEIKKCQLDDYNVLDNNKNISDFSLEDLTILDYDDSFLGNKYFAKIFMIFLPGEDYYGLTLEIVFEKSIIMWNDFRQVSWFEPFNKSSFIWNKIRSLLDLEGKTFLQKQNDLYTVINLVYKIRETGPVYSEDTYKIILNDELINHELNDVEEKFIIDFFKCLIIRHSELDIFCIGCLGKYPTKDDYEFLFTQLKQSIFEDECVTVSLLRELNFWQSSSYIAYLEALKVPDHLSSEFKHYFSKIIEFKKGKVGNMSEPSVRYDNNGKNRYIEW